MVTSKSEIFIKLQKKWPILHMDQLIVNLCKFLIFNYRDIGDLIVYLLKIFPRNIFMSFHESLSASALYSIGILNFFPVAVASGLVKA